MIKSYQTKANLGIAVGFLLSVASGFIAAPMMAPNASGSVSPGALLSFSLIRLFGGAIFIYGCVMYAKGKGRSGWWGAFGLLSLIGLIVLVCLKDHAKDGFVTEPRGFAPIMPSEGRPTLPPRM